MVHKKTVTVGPRILGKAFSAAILNLSDVSHGCGQSQFRAFFSQSSSAAILITSATIYLRTLINLHAQPAEVQPIGAARWNAMVARKFLKSS
jgi:hypothetical protein